MATCEAHMSEKAMPVITEANDDLRMELDQPAGVADVLIVRLIGQIDFYNSRYFGRQLRHLLENEVTRYVVDLRSLTYISSTGIGELIGFYKEVRMAAGRIVLSSAPAKFLDVLSLLGFAGFFEIVETEIAGVTHLQSAGASAVFPKFSACPICRRKLRLTREGHFRCPDCRSIVRVTRSAEIILG